MGALVGIISFGLLSVGFCIFCMVRGFHLYSKDIELPEIEDIHTKQVIIIRKDLKMRKGKIAAQAAHASMGVITRGLEEGKFGIDPRTGKVVSRNANHSDERVREWILKQDPVFQWMDNSFTKICVYVESEQELIDLYQKALDNDVPSILIEDNGATEFNGVKTKTCVAVGPACVEDVDKVTKGLPLL